MEKRIGFIGDSITAGYCDEEGLGWVGRLINIVGKNHPNKYYFYNISEGGDRSCDAYHHITSEVIKKDTDILIIAIGVNDIVRRGTADASFDISELLSIKYWHKIFDIIHQQNITPVVLDVLPVIEKVSIYENDPPLYNFNKDVIAYNHILRDICGQRNAVYIERFNLWQDRNLEALYVDAVHPNGVAHQMIADELYEKLRQKNII